MTHRFWLLEC